MSICLLAPSGRIYRTMNRCFFGRIDWVRYLFRILHPDHFERSSFNTARGREVDRAERYGPELAGAEIVRYFLRIREPSLECCGKDVDRIVSVRCGCTRR